MELYSSLNTGIRCCSQDRWEASEREEPVLIGAAVGIHLAVTGFLTCARETGRGNVLGGEV